MRLVLGTSGVLLALALWLEGFIPGIAAAVLSVLSLWFSSDADGIDFHEPASHS